MYKVGDKVRIVHTDYCECGLDVGTIHEVDDCDEYGVSLKSVGPACKGDGLFFYHNEIKPYTAPTFQVGETYTTASGHANKCIHIENGIAWCVSVRDDGTAYGPAYTWDMDGNYMNAPVSDLPLYKITFCPTVERKTVIASVDYVDGAPDWETVEVVG